MVLALSNSVGSLAKVRLTPMLTKSFTLVYIATPAWAHKITLDTYVHTIS